LHTGFVLKEHVSVWLVEWTRQFSTLEHAVWQCLVVTSTDHENSWALLTKLNHLEIMWEVASEIHSSVLKCSRNHIEDGDGFRVLLEYEEFLWELASGFDDHVGRHVIKLLSNCMSSILNDSCVINWLESITFTAFFLYFHCFFACLKVLEH